MAHRPTYYEPGSANKTKSKKGKNASKDGMESAVLRGKSHPYFSESVAVNMEDSEKESSAATSTANAASSVPLSVSDSNDESIPMSRQERARAFMQKYRQEKEQEEKVRGWRRVAFML